MSEVDSSKLVVIDELVLFAEISKLFPGKEYVVAIRRKAITATLVHKILTALDARGIQACVLALPRVKDCEKGFCIYEQTFSLS